MITLISRWQLKNGAPPALINNLRDIAYKVKQAEPDTLMYLVNLPASAPGESQDKPKYTSLDQIPPEKQKEVVFMEIYLNADAFERHVNGPVFTQFRDNNIQYFQEDPNKPGWPVTITTFLERESAFIRPAAGME